MKFVRGLMLLVVLRLVLSMALIFGITNAVAISMLGAFRTAANAGTAAVIEIYSGSVPTDADTALGAQVLLATLTCAADIFSGIADGAPGAVGTLDTVAPDTSADATGTATFFRIKTQTGGTVIAQGSVGTATSDMIINTTAITAGSQVELTSGTITMPEQA